MRKQICLLGLMLLTGCTGMNNTQEGALTGGVLGGLFGALVGGRHPLAAAAIGAGGGAVLGGVIGNNADRQDDRRKEQTIAAINAQAARQMSLNDIVQMAQQGQSDAVIIGQINNTGSVFPNMTADDANFLHQQRVSDAVISYMQQRRYVVVQPRPVYVYDRPYYPPPPPPIGVGVVIGGR